MSKVARILDMFSSDWLLTEITHKVSKTGSNKLWDTAMKYIPMLIEAVAEEHYTRKIPKFSHLRRLLYTRHVPRITMSFGFLNRETGELKLETGTETPLRKFPPAQYKRVYEYASVDIADLLSIHAKGNL